MPQQFNSDSAPARGVAVVTPNDGTDLPGGECRALLIGTAGNVAIDTEQSTNVIVPAPVGVLPIAVKRVRSTNTTALNIVALY